MSILLREATVRQLLSMDDALSSVEGFFNHVNTDAVNTPRTRSIGHGAVLHVMHASLSYLGRAGVKSYLSTQAGTEFQILLYDLRSGELLAVMGADHLGRYRTGAASGIATRHLCSLRSFRLCMLGSGSQAPTQLQAISKVAKIEGVNVWSPTKSSRERFAMEVRRDHGLDCNTAESPHEAFKNCEVAATITSSGSAFISSDMVRDVVHLNAAGSNRANRAELMPEAVSAFGTVCVDDLSQARVESGDLIQAAASGVFNWERAIELGQVLRSREHPTAKTLFKSNGVAGEDVALASIVYDKAVRGGYSDGTFDLREKPAQ